MSNVIELRPTSRIQVRICPHYQNQLLDSLNDAWMADSDAITFREFVGHHLLALIDQKEGDERIADKDGIWGSDRDHLREWLAGQAA